MNLFRTEELGSHMIFEAKTNSQGLIIKLAELGLEVSEIHEVLRFSYAESLTYTEFDAPGAVGTARWTRAVRKLSEICIPKGWIRTNPDNQPTIIHPNQKHCIIVASGNIHTGILTGTSPTTKNPRGPSFRKAVARNAQMQLFGAEPQLEDSLETWVLLIRTAADGKIYSELSLPSNMEGDFISNWEHRILISTLELDGSPITTIDIELADYNFEIERK